MNETSKPLPPASPPSSPGSSPTELSPEREYERLNPGAGGPPGQQQERGEKGNPRTTRDDGGAAIPGSQNEDVGGRPQKGPRGGST